MCYNLHFTTKPLVLLREESVGRRPLCPLDYPLLFLTRDLLDVLNRCKSLSSVLS